MKKTSWIWGRAGIGPRSTRGLSGADSPRLCGQHRFLVAAGTSCFPWTWMLTESNTARMARRDGSQHGAPKPPWARDFREHEVMQRSLEERDLELFLVGVLCEHKRCQVWGIGRLLASPEKWGSSAASSQRGGTLSLGSGPTSVLSAWRDVEELAVLALDLPDPENV